MKWSEATKEIEGRSGKQIRERWFNILNPQINKAKWSQEEERMLFSLYHQHGPKWCSLVNHFKNRTENSIKNRFYSTLRRVATEYKRNYEKEIKKKAKSKINTDSTDKIEMNFEPEADIDELYIDNPQVAKTSELLRFLPNVNEELGVDSVALLNSSDKPRKNNKTNKSSKSRSSNLRKRTKRKTEIANMAEEGSSKRQKVYDEEQEEEKETKEEKDDKEDNFNNLLRSHIPQKVDIKELQSKGISDCMAEVDLPESHLQPIQNLSKPCLSVNSINFDMHSNDHPFKKMEGHIDRKHDFNIDISKVENGQSFDLSENDFSQEWKDLEEKLLAECNILIEDLNREQNLQILDKLT